MSDERLSAEMAELEAIERDWSTVAIVIGVLVISNVMTNRVLPGWAYVVWNVSVAAALTVVARRVDRVSWRDLGLDRRDLRSGLRWGSLCVVVIAAIYGIGLAIPSTRHLFEDSRASGDGWSTLYRSAVAVPFGTVLLEEVAFRGVLPAVFGHRVSRRGAIAWSSVLFGIWHVLPSWNLNRANPVARDFLGGSVGRAIAVGSSVVATAVVGVLFCWLRDRSRSLLAPVMLHVSINSLAYLGAWLVLR